jgi:hypothetical protein
LGQECRPEMERAVLLAEPAAGHRALKEGRGGGVREVEDLDTFNTVHCCLGPLNIPRPCAPAS